MSLNSIPIFHKRIEFMAVSAIIAVILNKWKQFTPINVKQIELGDID